VAIENIVENALRFATSTIQISCAKQGHTVQIKIYNDGSSLENPKKIFERYQTESRGNTGLGMAITKEIVENHKGHILAQNEENGVSFIIQLPV
jgi:two-component system sensor histidine kinase CssS